MLLGRRGLRNNGNDSDEETFAQKERARYLSDRAALQGKTIQAGDPSEKFPFPVRTLSACPTSSGVSADSDQGLDPALDRRHSRVDHLIRLCQCQLSSPTAFHT